MNLKTTKGVIAACGGNKKFAALLEDGTTPQAVNNWAKSKFPANRYILITSLCDIAGVRISDSLFAMRTRKRRR
ncbi:MAG: hypothetical protein ABWY64_26530 [Tardiphaga sp.]